MKIEFLPARASTLTRGPVFVCMGSGRRLNGHCDFSWGSPGPNQPRQSGPCNYNPSGRDSGHRTCTEGSSSPVGKFSREKVHI